MNSFAAAIGSFSFDHNELFYVDFDKVALNVYREGESYLVEVGAGRAESYLVDGVKKEDIPTLTEKYNAALTAAVQDVSSKAKSTTNYSIHYMRAFYTNQYLCDNVVYGFGTDSNGKETSDAAWIASAYGALVNGECICEGYSRAFKAIMDQLNETSVLVTGYLLSNGGSEPHMWNAVLDGTYTKEGETLDAWFGVDVTANDSSRYESSQGQKSQGDYCMVSGDFIEVDHIYEKRIISGADYEMPYPELVRKPITLKTGLITAGWQAYNGSRSDLKNSNATVMAISLEYPLDTLESMGYYPAFAGVENYGKANEKCTWSSLRYLLAAYKDLGNWWMEGNVVYLIVTDGQSLSTFKIGLFDCAQDVKSSLATSNPDLQYDRYSSTATKYHLIEEQVYENPQYNPTFVIPAFINYGESTPNLTMQGHDILKTLEVKVVYTQNLIQIDDTLSNDDVNNITWTADPFFKFLDPEEVKSLTKLEDFHWDGFKTITFKLTVPSGYQYNRTGYKFELTNFVGDCSDQTNSDAKIPVRPNSFGIYFRYYDEIACNKCSPDGKMKINTYGAPMLIGTNDLSLDGWSYTDDKGEERQVSDNQRSQLALVVTKPAEDVSNKMQTALEDNIATNSNIQADAVMESATYEIDLTLCGKYTQIPNGSHVTVNFGFPQGMSADDEGVTFKVYHFKRDGDGNLDYEHPEILDCIVTEYGITVYMDSFSPFMVVKFDSSKISEPTKKGIVVDYNAEGGLVQGIVKGTTATIIEEGQQAIYNIIPKEGYEVEFAMLNGNVLELSQDKGAMSYTFDYTLLADNNVLSVGFVAKSVKTAEENNNLVNVVVEAAQSSTVVSSDIASSDLPKPEDVVDFGYNNTPMTPSDSDNTPAKGTGWNNNTPLIIALVVISVVIVVATAMLIVLLKKKKSH